VVFGNLQRSATAGYVGPLKCPFSDAGTIVVRRLSSTSFHGGIDESLKCCSDYIIRSGAS